MTYGFNGDTHVVQINGETVNLIPDISKYVFKSMASKWGFQNDVEKRKIEEILSVVSKDGKDIEKDADKDDIRDFIVIVSAI